MRGEEEGGMQPSTRRGDKRHGGGNIVSTPPCSNSNQLHEERGALTATSDAIVAKGLRSISMRAFSSSSSANT